MKKETIQKIKKELEKEKAEIEKSLEGFAKKDKRVEGDWDTIFPNWNGETSSDMEIIADEVEEYSGLLPLEYMLELRLKNINLSLKKIKEGGYGICEKCGKKISQQRLKAYPEARFCKKCK